MSKKNIIEYNEPFSSMDFKKVGYEVLYKMVKEQAMELVEQNNENPLHHQVKSKGSCSCDAGTVAAPYTEDVTAVRASIMEDYRVEVDRHPRNVLEPKKPSNKGTKISREKLRNLIKAEVLRQTETQQRRERRLAALKRLTPQQRKRRKNVLKKLKKN